VYKRQSVPIVDGDSNLHDLLGPTAWGGIAAFVASILALLWFVRRAMISPLRQLSDYATRTSESDVADIDAQSLRISEADEESRNEVHRMTVAIKRLLRSLKVQRKY
jgi:HAMP domain-containing protein